MLPSRTARGFARPENTPVYVVAGSDLVAFDVTNGEGRELFSEPVEFLEHCIVCGTPLIVPDMERLFALDYRSGEIRWELEFEQARLIESLGVTEGVLHVSVQPAVPDGNSELIGVEPLTGARLFTRALDERCLKPKPIDDQLLLMSVTDQAASIERVDPLTGATSIAGSPAAAMVASTSSSTRATPPRLARTPRGPSARSLARYPCVAAAAAREPMTELTRGSNDPSAFRSGASICSRTASAAGDVE